jgi:hypothetical protein
LTDAGRVSSIISLSKKLPFDAPTPEPPSTAEVIGTTAAAIGVIAADVATGGLLSTLAGIPSPSCDEKRPVDITPLLATIADTSAPARDADGNAACSRCGEHVPYETMSLNEHGYFCARCAATLTDEALR